MNTNTRLKVEYVNGSSRNCYHVTISKVTSMYALSDEKVIQAVVMAGLGCGQVVKIIDKSILPIQDETYPEMIHKYNVYTVQTECDSGD